MEMKDVVALATEAWKCSAKLEYQILDKIHSRTHQLQLAKHMMINADGQRMVCAKLLHIRTHTFACVVSMHTALLLGECRLKGMHCK